ncbi:MAG: aminotransferase class I/II-fold pyridoxal phosphate-dependent enzyme, partial [Paludibacteraceae bacterium]|nr:aminotransferase class I/II-fold pyridoxal phosphate-dependent enzyme [Paludibacteraceae bacterium]
GRYTMNCVHLVSCSKIFSYAGERAAVIAVNPDLAHRHFPALTVRYNSDGQFMRTLVYQILYAISSGVSHSVQYAMAAMMTAACEGRIDFVKNTHVYADRAKRIKDILAKHHFNIVYDKDANDRPVGDGFFFTFTYRDWTGEQLINKLIYYGVSAITLISTGAKREGLRGCAASVREDQYDALDERLALFDKDYSPKE